MTTVHRLLGLAGARRAAGATIVIDTFRAFSTAAYLLDRGVAELILTSTLEEAAAVAAARPGALLCGEEGGARPAGFDLGNSPGEVLAHGALDGATVVQRTSSGTGCLLAAVAAGAAPVYAASLVVAEATARCLLAVDELSIVASGRGGAIVADEDEVTADYLGALVAGSGTRPDLDRIRNGEPGDRFRRAPWAHRDDLELCLDVDRFGFAMSASADRGLVRLHRRWPGDPAD